MNVAERQCRLSAALRTLVLAAVCLGSGVAAGQVKSNLDYYKANASPESAQTLRNVEQFHLDPGVRRMKERNFAGALQDFEFILNYFPNHPKVLSLVSELCDLTWKNAQCEPERYFERAIEINPRVAQTFTVYGLHFQRRNNLPRAVESYGRALELNPASSNAHYNLGLAYFDQKRFDLANLHAQASYALGFPLSGLRDKLTRAGQWKPLSQEEIARAITPVDVRDEKAK
jgi:tetratricopeptide (TPR) repeat protein